MSGEGLVQGYESPYLARDSSTFPFCRLGFPARHHLTQPITSWGKATIPTVGEDVK